MARPSLKAQTLTDMSLLFEDIMPWTIPCTYTPRGGSPVVVDCFLSGQIDTFTNMEKYIRGEETAEIYVWFKQADMPVPQWRDKFNLQGTDWWTGTEGVVKYDEYSVKIHLERNLVCE